MKLPSHLLTRLYLTGAVGTVCAVVTCESAHRPAHRTECKPIANAVDDTPLSDVVRMTRDPEPLPLPTLQPQPQQPRQPQVKPRPKPPRAFASSCGHLVPIDLAKPTMLLKACGKG